MAPAIHTCSSPSSQRGFNMVEVLVAMAVLSIGLLGLAGLQTIGLKLTHESYGRTQAVLQAYDIIDRMRTNKTDSAVNTAFDDVALGATPGTMDCTGTGSNCSPTDLAQFDIREWNQANARLLPEGRGAICKGEFNGGDLTDCDAGGTVYQIGITWREQDADAQIVVEAQL